MTTVDHTLMHGSKPELPRSRNLLGSVTLQIVVARVLLTATAPTRCARHTVQTLSGHQSAASRRNLERRT
jgi:hypothetical protein